MPKSRARRRPPPRATAPRATAPPTTAPRATAPRGAVAAPPAPGRRAGVERASMPVLHWLSARPKALLPLLSVALLLGGLVAPLPLGVPLLLLLVLLVGWLTYLSWPAVDRGGHGVRLLTVGVLAALLVVRLFR